MRQRAAEIMGGEIAVNEWEIVVLHRMHEAREGACTRVIWSKGDPGQMDRVIDAFRMGMISRIEELPGFSASAYGRPRQGPHATAVNYDDREQ